MKSLLAASGLVGAASAFSAISPSATAAASSVLAGLQSTPLIRASDASPVVLPDLWRSKTPFGVADEIAVVAFLRHYG